MTFHRGMEEKPDYKAATATLNRLLSCSSQYLPVRPLHMSVTQVVGVRKFVRNEIWAVP